MLLVIRPNSTGTPYTLSGSLTLTKKASHMGGGLEGACGMLAGDVISELSSLPLHPQLSGHRHDGRARRC